MIATPAPCVRIVIPGTPIAQGRGIAVRRGEHVRVVDPKRSRDWKAYAATYMQAAMCEAEIEPMVGPVELRVTAWWALKKAPRIAALRPKRPDADNVAKAVKDAASGVLWIDDAQVVRMLVEKWQAPQGEPARVEVVVQQLLAEGA